MHLLLIRVSILGTLRPSFLLSFMSASQVILSFLFWTVDNRIMLFGQIFCGADERCMKDKFLNNNIVFMTWISPYNVKFHTGF